MAEHAHTAPGSTARGGASPSDEERAAAARHEAHALIAHELRAPLTVIKGYIEMLERPMDEETRLTALAAADRAADRLDTMLDDLLAASTDLRVFAPRQLEPTDLLALAESVADEVRPLHDHSIIVSGASGVAVCDRRLIRQLLANLVGNALKHTPGDGTIRTTVAEEGDEVVVRVEDEGQGVAAEDRERVFELFSRLGSPETMPQGLGLGLPVSRVIAEQHGGSLRLVDGESCGACFEFRIPRTR